MQAYGDNLVVTQIDQPEESVVKTTDGKHRWALEVLSVGDLVEGLEEGYLIAASGQLNGLGNSKYCTIHKTQVKAIVSEDEL